MFRAFHWTWSQSSCWSQLLRLQCHRASSSGFVHSHLHRGRPWSAVRGWRVEREQWVCRTWSSHEPRVTFLISHSPHCRWMHRVNLHLPQVCWECAYGTGICWAGQGGNSQPQDLLWGVSAEAGLRNAHGLKVASVWGSFAHTPPSRLRHHQSWVRAVWRTWEHRGCFSNEFGLLMKWNGRIWFVNRSYSYLLYWRAAKINKPVKVLRCSVCQLTRPTETEENR